MLQHRLQPHHKPIHPVKGQQQSDDKYSTPLSQYQGLLQIQNIRQCYRHHCPVRSDTQLYLFCLQYIVRAHCNKQTNFFIRAPFDSQIGFIYEYTFLSYQARYPLEPYTKIPSHIFHKNLYGL